MSLSEPVASEPRLFVGQVPPEKTEDDLMPLFAPYGSLTSLQLVNGPDGRSRGCAMVLYEKWGHAEAAMEAHDGKTVLDSNKGRPLVVHFANPRRSGPGQVPEQGIAPKKLFVGQVPKTVTEDDLRPLFEPYGEIEDLTIHRKGGQVHAGCAFLQYKKWAQCEAAMEAHNGKTRVAGADVPLVVKFADAKKKETQVAGVKRGSDAAATWQNEHKRPFLNGGAAPAPAYGLGMTMPPMGYGAMGYGAFAAQDPAMAAMGLGFGMNPLAMGAYQANLMGMGGMGGMGGLAQMANSVGMGMGMSAVAAATPPSLGGGKLGKGVGDDNAAQWKLFVGQVPLEASEYDLWPLFSPIGEILEMYVLKTKEGKSKGCAFVTYASRGLAQQAAAQLNGRHMGSKTLVVRFAERNAKMSIG